MIELAGPPTSLSTNGPKWPLWCDDAIPGKFIQSRVCSPSNPVYKYANYNAGNDGVAATTIHKLS